MSWICKCGYTRKGDEDGFKLLGAGKVECPRCKTVQYVKEVEVNGRIRGTNQGGG